MGKSKYEKSVEITDNINSELTTDDKSVKTTDTKRVFQNTDMIECISVTPGQLFVEGKRSGDLYTFADMDDVQEIRYDDLMYALRSKLPCIFKPRFIILDEDFVAQHSALDEVYSDLYTSSDLRDILKMPVKAMKSKMASLPAGSKDAIKVIAITMIENGTLDSISKIKAIDEVFGTEMLIKLVNN